MENGGNWFSVTTKSQISQIQWNNKTGKIRVKKSKEDKWTESDKPVKAMFALQKGYTLLEELKERELR